MLNIHKEVATMQRLTVDELRSKYADVFHESTNARNKVWLMKRIAWRMQANAEGDLSARAKQRAFEIANDADIRTMPPKPAKISIDAESRTVAKSTTVKPHAELLPGMKLQREYKGQRVSVLVINGGFEFQGERYKSLTAVAKAVTGKHWNGHHFFKLRSKAGKA